MQTFLNYRIKIVLTFMMILIGAASFVALRLSSHNQHR